MGYNPLVPIDYRVQMRHDWIFTITSIFNTIGPLCIPFCYEGVKLGRRIYLTHYHIYAIKGYGYLDYAYQSTPMSSISRSMEADAQKMVRHLVNFRLKVFVSISLDVVGKSVVVIVVAGVDVVVVVGRNMLLLGTRF